ncbi:MAG TPA: PilZ domain-containing protein [Pyrinomonadaceae bacterium]|nr:PilZ domain-containing protein [Pyrinomonadaceae bacterium]
MTDGGRERRRRERVRLSLPVRVVCREAVGDEWTEQTRLEDVTPFGASFRLRRPVDLGRLVHLHMPMPRQLRCFDHIEDQYRVWALVRRVTLAVETEGGGQLFGLGVAFVGKHPPASYKADPRTRYEIAADPTDQMLYHADERKRAFVESRETRLTMPVEVMVEVLDEHGAVTQSEQTVTENISRTGAAVFTSLKVERGRFVRLRSARYSLSVLAVVRGRRKGADNIDRLHLEFVDRRWPLEILG